MPARAINRQSSPLILGRAKELTELSTDLSSGERLPKLEHHPERANRGRYRPDYYPIKTRSKPAERPATCGYVVDCIDATWRTEKRLLLCRFLGSRVPTPPSRQQITLYGPQCSDQVSDLHNPRIRPNLTFGRLGKGGFATPHFTLSDVGRQDVAPAPRTDAKFQRRSSLRLDASPCNTSACAQT